MSKFFRAGAASESETESESDESDIQQPVRPAPVKPLFSASESEEEEKRVVRAAKDKRFDELKELIKQLRNSKKIKDMSKILTVFEDLSRAFVKAKPLIDKEGGFTPRFYLRCLVELEDFVNENWEDREGRKNLSKNNARGLTTLRQKLKKYIRDFEEEANEYRQNPDPEGYSTDEEESETEDEEDEAPVKMAPAGKEPKKERPKKDVESDEDEEGSDWEESTSEESELEDLAGKKLEELRLFFLKKDEKKKEDKDKEKQDRRKDKRKDREKLQREKSDDEGEWQPASGTGAAPAERPKMFEKDSEITPEAVIKKLNELLAARGKKGTDRRLLVENLKELYTIAESHNFGPAVGAKVLHGVIAGIFDYNPKISDCMVFSSWQSALSYIKELLQILKANPKMYCSEFVSDEGENILDTTQPIKLRVSVLSVFERLDDEFTKILQDADCHSTDYVDKLKGEKDICDLIVDIQGYLETTTAETEELCRIFMRRIDHLYYKFDKSAMAEDEANANATEKSVPNSREIMEKLCQFIYTMDSTKRLRTRAMLCHIYHHALHGRWHEARDLILMSHLQGAIDHSDIATQILYNRTVCQLGLCAFRHGYIRDAHSALSDIQNSGKAKELLAQGVILRGQDRTPEQEKIERQRQIPYHMHINLELLECVYLICAMLLEIPQMASKEFEVRRRMISRSFHYQLRQSERQSLVGPPENTREHVVAASRALLNGDWQACRDFIVNDKMNAKVWNLFHHNDKVKSMIIRRIQEECLRTYLFTYSSIYDSISLKKLALMFELEQKAVHAIISKMIIQEELSASLDEPAECVVMHRVEPTRLQTLALQLTEKLNHLAENVEQIMDPRSGGQGFAYRQNWGQRQQNADQQKQDEHGGGGGGRGRRQDYGKRQHQHQQHHHHHHQHHKNY